MLCMATVIYTEGGRRDLGASFCWHVSQGASDRSAAELSGLCRRTFARWCRQSPDLAARYAQAVQARADLYRRRRARLKALISSERRALRGAPAKSAEGKAARVRVRSLCRELMEFSNAVCCVRLRVPRRMRHTGNRRRAASFSR